MENFSLLMHGFQTASTFANLTSAVIGAIIGLIVGAMPGIGSLSGVALLLPLTFKMDPTTAMIGLAALYYSNMYGGAFTSILLNIPGESTAICTAMDGYPLARSGRAGTALSTSTWSSFWGGTIGIVILTIGGPFLAEFGLRFGPPDLALLILFAMTSIAWILGEKPSAGILATGLGVLLATIGVDKTVGSTRFTFGSNELLSGVAFIPLVIGMFGFDQVIDMIINRHNYTTEAVKKVTFRETVLKWKDIKAIMPATARTGVLGTLIGVLPGAGATAASFICYLMEKRINKNRAMIGKGAIEGVAAAESANNAAGAGVFAPLLCLGIPGGGTTAVLLGGLMMWGLRPGPLLFKDSPDFVWGLIASMYIGNIICLIISFSCIPIMMRVVRVPAAIMAPVITVICVVGAYTANNSMFDVFLMVGMGFLSYFMGLSKIPVAPLLLAFVLTQLLENYVRQSFDISNGEFSIFLKSNISITLLTLIVVFSFSPILMKYLKKKFGKEISPDSCS